MESFLEVGKGLGRGELYLCNSPSFSSILVHSYETSLGRGSAALTTSYASPGAEAEAIFVSVFKDYYSVSD